MTYVVMEDTVPTEVDAVRLCRMQCDCNVTSAGCSDPAVVTVPTGLSENVDAVLMQWMQCPTMWIPYVVTEDAVPTCWLQ